jgi:large subunit ribosomal protein L15
MKLNEIGVGHPRKKRRRVGRGIGSGRGKTAGRGGKGQTARSGVSIKGFEGGQMPIHRRLPKIGFTGRSKKSKPSNFDFDDLARCIESKKFDPNELITDEILRSAGLLQRSGFGKLLSDGDPPPGLRIQTYSASRRAIQKLEGAGGQIWVEVPSGTVEQESSDSEKGEPAMMLSGSIERRGDQLSFVFSIEAAPSEQEALGDFEFVLSPKDSVFETRAFRPKQMISKSSEHKLVYEIKLAGESSGPRPSVELMTIFRRNFVGTHEFMAAETRREFAV